MSSRRYGTSLYGVFNDCPPIDPSALTPDEHGEILGFTAMERIEAHPVRVFLVEGEPVATTDDMYPSGYHYQLGGLQRDSLHFSVMKDRFTFGVFGYRNRHPQKAQIWDEEQQKYVEGEDGVVVERWFQINSDWHSKAVRFELAL